MTTGDQSIWYPKRTKSPWGDWRYCHAASARKHRRKGHVVKFSHWTSTGRVVYMWRRKWEDAWSGTIEEWVERMTGRLSPRPYAKALLISTPRKLDTFVQAAASVGKTYAYKRGLILALKNAGDAWSGTKKNGRS